jgi:predicted amidohydrolase
MKIAIAQIAPKLSPFNLQKHKNFIEKTEADLVVFPELSMNGYKIKDALLEDAFNLDFFDDLKFDKDVILGAATKEGGRVYNSAIYLGKEKIIYHKKHLPTYGVFEEGRFFFRGSEFKSFNTKFGKSTIFICEDVFSSDAFEFVSKEKHDLIIVISASPAREFKNNSLLIEEQWDALLKSLAILSGGYVVFANRVGFEDGLGFWGGSKVILPDGKISHSCELFKENILTFEIDTKDYLFNKQIN